MNLKIKMFSYGFNRDISFDILLICRKISAHADEGHLEGSVSQNFDLGPTLILNLCTVNKSVEN